MQWSHGKVIQVLFPTKVYENRHMVRGKGKGKSSQNNKETKAKCDSVQI